LTDRKIEDFSVFWKQKPSYNFNHGSFGATPQVILDRQAAWEASFNADREYFYHHDIPEALGRSKAIVAQFVGASIDDLVFVDNATDAMNTVIKSLALGAGDDVVITSFIYGPFDTLLQEISRRNKFNVIKAVLPYPPQSDEDLIDPVLTAVTPATRLVIIDHISSPTGIIMPVKKIVAALNKRGIDCFVDGAHAPGQIPVNVTDIGAAYYTANHHKWICAPIASGFLHVRKDRQDPIMPAVGSSLAGQNTPFARRFDWIGTKGTSSAVMVGETIDYMGSLHPQGWAGIYKRNHEVTMAARDLIMNRLDCDDTYPEHMIGNMLTIRIKDMCFPPEIEQLPPSYRLYELMVKEFGFGPYAMPSDGSYLLRLSVPLYLNLPDFEVLAEALQSVIVRYGK